MKNNKSKYANSVFEQPWWLNVVAQDKWYDIKISNNDQIIARWPLYISSKNITMPIMTQTLGFWVSDDILLNDIYYNKINAVTLSLIEKLPPKNINIDLDPSVQYFLPFFWNRFVVKPRISYRIKSLKDIESIYLNFNKIVKKNIKSSLKKVTIICNDDIDSLYDLMEMTFRIQNRNYPYTRDAIRDIYNACKVNNAGRLLFAIDKDGNIHSGSLFVYDENVCYHLISGTNPLYRSSGANSLIIWEGIKFASKVSKSFDFEGSMIEGIENFYRQFGGEQIIYYQIIRQKMLYQIFHVIKPYIKKIIGYK